MWFNAVRAVTYRSLSLYPHPTPERVCSQATLQSIYVKRDYVILKFEGSVQIYVAVLNIGCEIQNSSGNVVSFLKINSFEISFLISYFYLKI